MEQEDRISGKYAFALADSETDRNMVRIVLEDSNGQENLVATVLVVPDNIANSPDQPMIRFEERRWGTPEATAAVPTWPIRKTTGIGAAVVGGSASFTMRKFYSLSADLSPPRALVTVRKDSNQYFSSRH